MAGKWTVEVGQFEHFVYSDAGKQVARFTDGADARACVEAHNAGGEPVAYEYQDQFAWNDKWYPIQPGGHSTLLQARDQMIRAGCKVRPLYTAPQPAADEWRDIASAPKDGTKIDLWMSDGRREIDCVWWVVAHGPRKGNGIWRRDPATLVDGIPTHFRIPTAPGSSPTAPVDARAVAIVERLRKQWGRDASPFASDRRYDIGRDEAADEILAAIRKEIC